MKMWICVLGLCTFAASAPGQSGADAGSVLKQASRPSRLAVWKSSTPSPGGPAVQYHMAAVSNDGRYCTWSSPNPSGTDPAQLACFDGKDLFVVHQPGIYDRVASDGKETRLVLSHWLLNPTPLLEKIAQDIAAEPEPPQIVFGGGATEVTSKPAGITFRVEDGELTVVGWERGVGPATSKVDVRFSQFVGEGADRHPSHAQRTVIIGSGEKTRTIQTDFELVRFSAAPDAVAAALNFNTLIAKSDRRDLKTKNVYNSSGELKYNENDLLALTQGERPWYTRRVLWVGAVAVIAVAVGAYRLRAAARERRGAT